MGYKIIRPRRGIKSLWDAYKDKIYKTGEMLVESPESGVGTGPVNVKFGDGMTPYYALPYAIEAPINQAIEGSTKPITSGAVYEQNKNFGNCIRPIDTTKVIKTQTTISSTGSYTATEDCWAVVTVANVSGKGSAVMINNVMVISIYNSVSGNTMTDMLYLKKGDVLSFDVVANSLYTIYGVI